MAAVRVQEGLLLSTFVLLFDCGGKDQPEAEPLVDEQDDIEVETASSCG